MGISKQVLAVLLMFAAAAVSAQDYHPASPQEFVGYWKVLSVPIEQQPAASRARPLMKDICTYFLHDADGAWRSLKMENAAGDGESLRRCEYTKKQLDAYKVATGPTDLKWKNYKNLFIVENQSGSGLGWLAFSVDINGDIGFESAASPLVAVRKGDMIMALKNPETQAILWRAVLRRAPD